MDVQRRVRETKMGWMRMKGEWRKWRALGWALGFFLLWAPLQPYAYSCARSAEEIYEVAEVSLAFQGLQQRGDRGQVRVTFSFLDTPTGKPVTDRCELVLIPGGAVHLDQDKSFHREYFSWKVGAQHTVVHPVYIPQAGTGSGSVVAHVACPLPGNSLGDECALNDSFAIKSVAIALDGRVVGMPVGQNLPKEIQIRLARGEWMHRKGRWEGSEQSPTGKKRLIAYLSKEPRLDLEPVFRLDYEYAPKDPRWDPNDKPWDPRFAPGKPTWRVEGNIGTITQEGVFTATAFGKGKVCVKHGILEDCLDVEVVEHPNPSPPDKVARIILIPLLEPQTEGKVKAAQKRKFKDFAEIYEHFGMGKHPKVRVNYWSWEEGEGPKAIAKTKPYVAQGEREKPGHLPAKGRIAGSYEKMELTVTEGRVIEWVVLEVLADGRVQPHHGPVFWSNFESYPVRVSFVRSRRDGLTIASFRASLPGFYLAGDFLVKVITE